MPPGRRKGVVDADELRQHEVTLSAYCIDRTEVTVKAYADCVRAKGCTAAPLTVQWSGVSAEDVKRYSRFCNGGGRPDHPINCVGWNQAAAYCMWAGKRLPTEAEWEYAARGTDGRVYPWGDEAPSATRLNACGRECVAMAKRVLNADWRPMYDASDGWESTAPVGSFPAGASPFGALDMAGNVWEWTADRYGASDGSFLLGVAARTLAASWLFRPPPRITALSETGGMLPPTQAQPVERALAQAATRWRTLSARRSRPSGAGSPRTRAGR